ncbi:unnamed protein product [marine sediment metagenome]|uniref:Uncharacterized protein n=1 Tax=marine sediment metagenome TaxID=412755 RepID=X1JPV4_9ZZZZ
MNESEIHKIIENELKKRKGKIIAKNTINSILKIFPSAPAIWQLLTGSTDKLEIERHIITQEVLLDWVLAIDKKLNEITLDVKEQNAFEIMLDGIRAMGDVTGLRARTSDINLRKLFSEKDIRIIMRDIDAGGNVTGANLLIDCELELKKKLEIETDFCSVKFNPDVGNITFGKGLKPNEDADSE